MDHYPLESFLHETIIFHILTNKQGFDTLYLETVRQEP